MGKYQRGCPSYDRDSQEDIIENTKEAVRVGDTVAVSTKEEARVEDNGKY